LVFFFCNLENGWKKKEDEDVRERGEWEEIWCNDVNYGGIEQIFPWVQARINQSSKNKKVLF
jgi:hypothetical protein